MNDLGLNLHDLSRPGRRPAEVEVELVRAVTSADLELLATMPRGSSQPERKKMSERHHALARALAAGLSEGEAAAIVGYDRSTVSVLKDSPAFQELLDLHRTTKDIEFAETMAQIAGLAKDSVLELRDRLETEPDKIGTGMLLDIATKTLDRAGFGPVTKQDVNVRVDIASKLAAARSRARLAAQGMIDVTPEDENG